MSAVAERFRGSWWQGWPLAALGAFFLVVVVVDAVAGNGFNGVALAVGLYTVPEGLRHVARTRGNSGLARRLRTVTGYGLTLAGVVLWAVLARGWASGEGTDWLLFAAAVLLLLAGALALAGLISKRRSERSRA